MNRQRESGGRREPPAAKPYEFVRIPETRMSQERPTGHHVYAGDLLTGTVEGKLIALSPVHVASGSIEVTRRKPSLVKAHYRSSGKPTLPGSSLKGAIRSIVEAISNPPSCLRVTTARFDNLPANVKKCGKKDSLCISCRMFGAMGYLGQIRFSDAVMLHGSTEIIQIPSLFAPRSRERVYYERGKVGGRKFYLHGHDGKTAPGNVPIEACTVGATFSLRVDFENLSHGQLALLLCALGQGSPKLFPKLGGGKPACCGSIEIVDVTVNTISARALATDFDSSPNVETLASLVGATRQIDQNCLSQLATILTYPGDQPCPDRNY